MLYFRVSLTIAFDFACNSAGTEKLPDDDAHVSKHIALAELNSKLLENQCTCWLFITNIYKHSFPIFLALSIPSCYVQL
jgi:hypothetical protein